MSFAQTNKSPEKVSGTQNRQQRLSYANVTSAHSPARTHSPTRESLKATAHDDSVHSNVWKAGGSPASCSSLFFDLTSRSETRSTLLCHINASFPNNCGVRLHSDHSRRIVELFIDDSDTYQKARTSGLAFEDDRRILPSVPLPADSSLIHLRLSNLPFTSRAKLADGIYLALSFFGEVLDYGILRDHDSSLFMGHGYATLNISRSKQSPSLSHKISWPNSADWFYATWAEMPLHCLHCHEPGHSLSSCPSHPSQRRPCWSCGQTGHRAAKCPNSHRSSPKPVNVPPMSPSSSSSTASSSSSESDVSMLSADYSPLEAHNDMIISDDISKYHSDDPNAKRSLESYKPAMATAMFDSLVRKYPMSDEAKNILQTLPITVAALLRQRGQLFPYATPSSVSSGSVSSMRLKDT